MSVNVSASETLQRMMRRQCLHGRVRRVRDRPGSESGYESGNDRPRRASVNASASAKARRQNANANGDRPTNASASGLHAHAHARVRARNHDHDHDRVSAPQMPSQTGPPCFQGHGYAHARVHGRASANDRPRTDRYAASALCRD